MARADETFRNFETRVILREAKGMRSRDRFFMIGPGNPGALLHVVYGASTYATPLAAGINANGILLERNTLTGAVFRVMLTRNAEVTDAYINYGAHDRLTVNLALAANAGIIVRPAISESYGLAGGMFDDPEPFDPLDEAAQTLPAISEPAPLPAPPRAWAIVLTFRSWFVGLAFRFGRRRQ